MKTNFLQTTSLAQSRQYPRSIVNRKQRDSLSPGRIAFEDVQKNYEEELQELGLGKKGGIGLSKTVRVVGPRIKKLEFYDWEAKMNKAQQEAQQSLAQVQ